SSASHSDRKTKRWRSGTSPHNSAAVNRPDNTGAKRANHGKTSCPFTGNTRSPKRNSIPFEVATYSTQLRNLSPMGLCHQRAATVVDRPAQAVLHCRGEGALHSARESHSIPVKKKDRNEEFSPPAG